MNHEIRTRLFLWVWGFIAGIFIGLAICEIGMAHPASSERLTRDRYCASKANWATEIYDLVHENPKVILNGVQANDEDAFAFIRQWTGTREELSEYVINHCMGESI